MKAGGGQQSISPNHHPQPYITEKNVLFMDHQKMEPPDSAGTTPTVTLTRVLLSQKGGGGQLIETNTRPPWERRHTCTGLKRH